MPTLPHVVVALAVVLTASACDTSVPIAPARVTVAVPEGFEPLPVPRQNPLHPERVALGEQLFFDPILSRDRTVSCGTCHLPGLAFTDALPKSLGVDGRVGLRNAPTLLNVAYRPTLFWDGGALFLESQALVPIEEPLEMDLPLDSALARLQNHPEYPQRFARAFDGDGPSIQTLTYALAAFQRTLVSAPTAFDRYRAGDSTALAPEARDGLALFTTHCASCHAGPMLTTDRFENNGVSVTDADPGRERITFSATERGVFRVPSLRAVSRTAPYFHDGRFATLAEVVDYYNRGGDGSAGQSPRIQALRLSESERDAIVAFLNTFDDQPAPVHGRP